MKTRRVGLPAATGAGMGARAGATAGLANGRGAAQNSAPSREPVTAGEGRRMRNKGQGAGVRGQGSAPRDYYTEYAGPAARPADAPERSPLPRPGGPGYHRAFPTR